jgi:hypothetical protein
MSIRRCRCLPRHRTLLLFSTSSLSFGKHERNKPSCFLCLKSRKCYRFPEFESNLRPTFEFTYSQTFSTEHLLFFEDISNRGIHPNIFERMYHVTLQSGRRSKVDISKTKDYAGSPYNHSHSYTGPLNLQLIKFAWTEAAPDLPRSSQSITTYNTSPSHSPCYYSCKPHRPHHLIIALLRISSGLGAQQPWMATWKQLLNDGQRTSITRMVVLPSLLVGVALASLANVLVKRREGHSPRPFLAVAPWDGKLECADFHRMLEVCQHTLVQLAGVVIWLGRIMDGLEEHARLREEIQHCARDISWTDCCLWQARTHEDLGLRGREVLNSDGGAVVVDVLL